MEKEEGVAKKVEVEDSIESLIDRLPLQKVNIESTFQTTSALLANLGSHFGF